MAAMPCAQACRLNTMPDSARDNFRQRLSTSTTNCILFNDFTHFLVDPVHGDQEDQFENRNVIGSAANYTLPVTVAGIRNEIDGGLLDALRHFGCRAPAQRRSSAVEPAGNADDPASFSNHDNVNLFAGAIYLQATTHWTSWFRSVLGVRDDYQHGTDDDLLAQLHENGRLHQWGRGGQSLLQPKGSLIYTPKRRSRILPVGRRRLSQRRSARASIRTGTSISACPTRRCWRSNRAKKSACAPSLHKDFTLTFALYNLWQQSETIIDPDVGEDTAGPPSHRYGFEINTTYEITQLARALWQLLGQSRALHPALRRWDGTSRQIHHGCARRCRLARALSARSRALERRPGISLSRELSAVLGALRQFRRRARLPGRGDILRQRPDGARSDQRQGLRTAESRRRIMLSRRAGRASLGIYNLLNTHAAAAEFWYVDRLQSEIAAYPDGRADIHEHPLEPLMFRVSIAKQF